jgi:hypothetical protein
MSENKIYRAKSFIRGEPVPKHQLVNLFDVEDKFTYARDSMGLVAKLSYFRGVQQLGTDVMRLKYGDTMTRPYLLSGCLLTYPNGNQHAIYRDSLGGKYSAERSNSHANYDGEFLAASQDKLNPANYTIYEILHMTPQQVTEFGFDGLLLDMYLKYNGTELSDFVQQSRKDIATEHGIH